MVENVEYSYLKEEEYVCKHCGKDYNESQSCGRCVNYWNTIKVKRSEYEKIKEFVNYLKNRK